MSDQPLPQIRMKRPTLDGLMPIPALPPGYVLKTAGESDAAAIASLMNLAFETKEWDIARVMNELINHPGCHTTFIISHGDTAVASATLLLEPDNNPGVGILHWVASDTEHRGKQLGLIVSLAVLHQALSIGCSSSMLLTDDARIPAIKTYIKLGYEPDCWHESHESRWKSIKESIASR